MGIPRRALQDLCRQWHACESHCGLTKCIHVTGEIARLAMKRGLINCNGKTPDATMASALYTDLKRRDVHSIFIRPHEGLFGLREWTTEEDAHFEVCELFSLARPQYRLLGVKCSVLLEGAALLSATLDDWWHYIHGRTVLVRAA